MASSSQRIYFIGNSVTDTIQQTGLYKIAEAETNNLTWGRHMIPGAPLSWILENPLDGFQEPPFGYYQNALGQYQWDGLLLQPFDRALTGTGGDLESAKQFIDLALPESPNLQVYIYQRWPRITTEKPTADDWSDAWNTEYIGGWQNNETRSYFSSLTAAVRDAYPNLKPPKIVPVGEVMYELNQRMKAGDIPGYDSAWDLYSDAIHLNNVGSYVVASTFYATLFESNRTTNVIPPEYGTIESGLAKVLQDIVWETVSSLDLTNPGGGTTNTNPLIFATNVEVYEEDRKALVEVSLSKTLSDPVTVQYQTQDDSAIAGSDYLGVSGTLTFNPGETSKTVEISIISDTTVETEEDFILSLSNASNTAIGTDQAKITIRDTLTADTDTILPAGVNNLVLAGNNNIKGIGNSGDNIIQGNSGNNLLIGKAGYDRLIGKQGDDVYVIEGSYWDTVIEESGEGKDTVKASESYTLENNLEVLRLIGSNSINGTGNAGDNLILGNRSNNTLSGVEGNDFIKGGDGDDALFGGYGNDKLWGKDGDDSLNGENGNDWLDGGQGKDLYLGGKGRDTFVVQFNNRIDSILDFEDGKDKLKLKKLSFEELEISQQRKDTLISYKDKIIAELENVDSTLITAKDCI